MLREIANCFQSQFIDADTRSTNASQTYQSVCEMQNLFCISLNM